MIRPLAPLEDRPSAAKVVSAGALTKGHLDIPVVPSPQTLAPGRYYERLLLEDEWIDQLYVEPGHTGRGIGGRLMAVAKQQRLGALRLWVFEANVRARRFYERHGFVATGSTADDNEERAPDVHYEWTPSAGVP